MATNYDWTRWCCEALRQRSIVLFGQNIPSRLARCTKCDQDGGLRRRPIPKGLAVHNPSPLGGLHGLLDSRSADSEVRGRSSSAPRQGVLSSPGFRPNNTLRRVFSGRLGVTLGLLSGLGFFFGMGGYFAYAKPISEMIAIIDYFDGFIDKALAVDVIKCCFTGYRVLGIRNHGRTLWASRRPNPVGLRASANILQTNWVTPDSTACYHQIRNQAWRWTGEHSSLSGDTNCHGGRSTFNPRVVGSIPTRQHRNTRLSSIVLTRLAHSVQATRPPGFQPLQ